MSELLQIYEDDLSVLERELPMLMMASAEACNDPVIRKRWEAVQSILSKVRWNYGPPSNIETVEP